MGQLLIVQQPPAVVYKDPDEVRDFPVDWTQDIPAGITITTSTFLTTLTVAQHSHTDAATVVRLSGGTPGRYPVTNRVDLSNGEIYDFTFTVVIRDR